jgi:glycosyltransferase involved in cell wall biosynthesis
MRIGLDASLAGEPGGTGRYTRLLVRHLVGLDPEGEYRLYFRAQDEGVNPLRSLGGPRVRPQVVDGPHPLWRVHVGLARALRRDRVDVYHALAFFVPWFWRGPTVVTVHDIHPVLLRRHWWVRGSRRAYLVMRVHIPLALRRARVVLTHSAYVRDTIRARYGLPAERIVVTPPGADPFFLEAPAPHDLAVADARFGREPFFLSVGVLAPQKNPAGLVRAFARLGRRGERPAPRLVLAGRSVGGYAERHLVPLIAALGLTDRVALPGYVDDTLLRALYHRATALVMPSFGEGFGLPVLEAMASGTPVIAATGSSLPEVGGDAAVYVDPAEPAAIAEAMDTLLHDAARRDELRARGRARARTFTWERPVRRVLECYRG